VVTFTEIDAQALDGLRTQEHCCLVDVRSDAEFARGTIAGALHIPLQAIASRYGELDPAVSTVLFCQSGGRSAQACAYLAQLGYARLVNLRGGLTAWTRVGLPLQVP
jgi:rhodanese-related sulfurtransferase